MKMSNLKAINWVELREAAWLFAAQTVLYGVMCVNMRAVALVDYKWALASDFAIATMNFFVIRKIAEKEGNGWHRWAGYVAGSLTGTAAGIWISTLLTPG